MSLPDSGTRNVYSTGAQRDNREGKGRYDLISPYALRLLAIRLEEGAKKYEERNWEKGMDVGRYLDALQRHAGQLMMGDNSEDHVGAMLFNVMALAHTLEMIRLGRLDPSLDNLPYYDRDERTRSEQIEHVDSEREISDVQKTLRPLVYRKEVCYRNQHTDGWISVW